MRHEDQALSAYMHELEDLRGGSLTLALRDGIKAMGDAIKRSEARLEEAERRYLAQKVEPEQRSEDVIPPWLALQLDREAEEPVQEVLFGSAFALCQTALTRITSEIIRFQDVFMDARPKAWELLAKGALVEGTQCSRATAIYALANYFEHRDQWPRSAWDNPTHGDHTHTVPKLAELGLPPWPKLRCGAQSLGFRSGGELVRLVDDAVGLVDTLQAEIWAKLEPALSTETKWRWFGEP